jgi:hypothetical protein
MPPAPHYGHSSSTAVPEAALPPNPHPHVPSHLLSAAVAVLGFELTALHFLGRHSTFTPTCAFLLHQSSKLQQPPRQVGVPKIV